MTDTAIENMIVNPANATWSRSSDDNGGWRTNVNLDSDQIFRSIKNFQQRWSLVGLLAHPTMSEYFFLIIPMTIIKITEVIDFLHLEELVILPIATFAYHLESMPGRRLPEKQLEPRHIIKSQNMIGPQVRNTK